MKTTMFQVRWIVTEGDVVSHQKSECFIALNTITALKAAQRLAGEITMKELTGEWEDHGYSVSYVRVVRITEEVVG